jgi:GH15 family glucan-1,4-alpha-glucosidase
MNSFVQSYDSKELDAGLLLIPLVGFLPPTDSRVQGTVDAIYRHLNCDGFIRRYNPQTSKSTMRVPEGSFLACSFWMVDNLILIGRYDEARALFERLLSVRNDVGLLAEEYDTQHERQVGNFPQAFSHIGVINSAMNLTRAGGAAQQRSESEVPVQK